MITEPCDCGHNAGHIEVVRKGTPDGESRNQLDLDDLIDSLGYTYSCEAACKATKIIQDHVCDTEGLCDPTSGTCVLDRMSYEDIVSEFYISCFKTTDIDPKSVAIMATILG